MLRPVDREHRRAKGRLLQSPLLPELDAKLRRIGECPDETPRFRKRRVQEVAAPVRLAPDRRGHRKDLEGGRDDPILPRGFGEAVGKSVAHGVHLVRSDPRLVFSLNQISENCQVRLHDVNHTLNQISLPMPHSYPAHD